MNHPFKRNIPHIVFVRQMPPTIIWGGLEKLMLEWFERIDYSRCRATLVVSEGGGEIYTQHLQAKNLPVDVVDFPFRVDFRYTNHFFVRLIKTFKLFAGLKPQTIIFFEGSFVDFDFSHVLAAHWATGGKVFMHENLGPPEPSPKSSKKYLGVISGIGLWWYAERYLTRFRAYYSKMIFTVSDEIKKSAIKLWHYPAHKVSVLYHGVDVQRFSPSLEVRTSARQQMGMTPDDVVIIVAARLSQEKCIDRAIDAFDSIAREYPRLHLLIAGNGPYEDRLKTLALGKASHERIKFLGYVTNVDQLYRLSDIYVLSSDNEGLSLAFLEALASGLVCVATRCTGTSEVIENGSSGFLVEKNVEGVSEGLRKVLNLSNNARQSITRNAVQHIGKNFEINRNIQKAFTVLDIPYRSNQPSAATVGAQ